MPRRPRRTVPNKGQDNYWGQVCRLLHAQVLSSMQAGNEEAGTVGAGQANNDGPVLLSE